MSISNKLLFILVTMVGLGCSANREHKIKKLQYINRGRTLYQVHCGNCHGTEGLGLAKLVPPLKNPNYLIENLNDLPCIIKNGASGETIVNGVIFNHPMPGNPNIKNLEIAEIITFLVNKFNDIDTLITDQDVRKSLEKCQ